MSEFDAFMSEMFVEALDVGGTEEFTLGGVPYRGSLDEIVSEQRGLEKGGMAVIRSARLIVAKTEFAMPPILDTLGIIRGQEMCLGRLIEDSVFYTLDFTEAD